MYLWGTMEMRARLNESYEIPDQHIAWKNGVHFVSVSMCWVYVMIEDVERNLQMCFII